MYPVNTNYVFRRERTKLEAAQAKQQADYFWPAFLMVGTGALALYGCSWLIVTAYDAGRLVWL